MKKIIVSAAVAALAITTTASALEDIKVNGQAKVWYETDNATTDMFSKDNASAEVTFKLGMTGKQGNVGFGAEMTQGSTMGLEGQLVSGVRTSANNLDNQTGTGDAYVSKAYVVAPLMANTVVKMGRQELNTPLAFTEKWNAQQNNFDALVAINSSVKNLTVIGAYVGQSNTNGNHKATQEFNQMFNGAYAVGALYKNDMMGLNAWYYTVTGVADALWIDASAKVGPANVKAIVANMMPNADASDDTLAIALSAGVKVGGWNISAAASTVDEDGALAVANVATNFKKTKLPTAGVYLDGKAVAMPGATAIKLKAAGKVGSVGLAAQFATCSNDNGVFNSKHPTTGATIINDESASEIDLIASTKLGDFNVKGIIMHRDFENTDAQQHVRLITSINF